MESLTAKEVKASLRLMGAKYRVKIFESYGPSGIESAMNGWLDGIGSKIDIIEFFPVSVATATAIGMTSSPEISSPLRVEITTPGSGGGEQYCSTCSSTIRETLTTDQNKEERSNTVAAVGVLYIEHSEPQSDESP